MTFPEAPPLSKVHLDSIHKVTEMTTHVPYSIDELNALRDRAYSEAHILRKAAIRDFWRGVHRLMLSAIGGIRRDALWLTSQRNRRDSWLRSSNRGL